LRPISKLSSLQDPLIDFEETFRGTIDGASVHLREVLRQTLARNAALIFAHNTVPVSPSPARRTN
jgi:DNA repair protein RadC